MKYSLINIQILIIAFAAVFFSSCKEDENVVSPVFPSEVKTFNVLPGEEVELEFDANLDWKLFSSAIWCRFQNNQLGMSGEAGTCKVLLSVSNDMWSIDESSANISLSMGGEEKVIAQITRGSQNIELKDANGNVYGNDNYIGMSYNVTGINGKFSFTGNFNWELTSCPEWLTVVEGLPVKANKNQTVELNMNVTKKYWASSGEDNIVFKMQGSEQSVTIPVKYEGMPEGIVELEGIDNPWNWNISKDGKQYWKDGDDFNGGIEPTDFPLTFNVIAKDNKYAIVRIEQDGKYMNVDDENGFLTVENDGLGTVSIASVGENTGVERIAYIVVMPQNVYDEMKKAVSNNEDDYNGILLNEDGTKLHDDYGKYVAVEFTQEGESSSAGGFNIMMNGMTPLNAEKGDGGTGYGEYVISEYNISEDQIYSVSAPLESYLVVDPMLSQQEWMGEVVAINFEGAPIEPDKFEPGMNESERYTTGFTFSQPMIIIFKGTDMVNKKALIVIEQ